MAKGDRRMPLEEERTVQNDDAKADGAGSRPVSCSPAASGSLRCCLLSGGDSRRMGRDKALLRHSEGGTWLERSLGLLADVGGADHAAQSSSRPPGSAPAALPGGHAAAQPGGRAGLREHSLLRRLQSPAGDSRRPRQPPPRLAMRRWSTWAAEACADRVGAALR